MISTDGINNILF